MLQTVAHPETDLSLRQRAAAFLVGRHDFTTFRAVECQSRQPVRDVHFLRVWRQGPLIILDIQADGFLHHMVRNIAGVLMRIGEGKAEPEWVQDLIRVKDRTQGGVTANVGAPTALTDNVMNDVSLTLGFKF